MTRTQLQSQRAVPSSKQPESQRPTFFTFSGSMAAHNESDEEDSSSRGFRYGYKGEGAAGISEEHAEEWITSAQLQT